MPKPCHFVNFRLIKFGKYMAAKKTLDEFILSSKLIHGDKYDYSLITNDNYIDTKHEVEIICNICGNKFKQRPSVHLRGHGCRLCANKRISQSKKGVERKDLKRKIYGFGVCDVEYSVFFEDGSIMPSYNVWHDMLRRCYSEKLHKKEPAYIGCSVCDEWHRFSTFKDWFDANYIDGCYLDKDILVKGNKVYSPQTCCFVPREINNVIENARSRRGNTPMGVFERNGRYLSYVRVNGKRIYLGTFDTIEQAFEIMKERKEMYIKDLARKYYNNGKIAKNVYEALLNYKVEITD